MHFRKDTSTTPLNNTKARKNLYTYGNNFFIFLHKDNITSDFYKLSQNEDFALYTCWKKIFPKTAKRDHLRST